MVSLDIVGLNEMKIVMTICTPCHVSIIHLHHLHVIRLLCSSSGTAVVFYLSSSSDMHLCSTITDEVIINEQASEECFLH